jgi:hypothetical protein
METVLDSTIEGFNSFLTQQQKLPGEAKITFVQFDDQYEVVYDSKPIAEAPLLTRYNYVPRGWTALFDAIGKTIDAVGLKLASLPEDERPEKVIFVIQTDGAENYSKKFKGDKVLEMITHQKEKYSWEFLFLGANQDAVATAAKLGIGGAKTLSYNANPLSTRKAFMIASAGVSASRTGLDSYSYSNVTRGMTVDNTTLDQLQAQLDADLAQAQADADAKKGSTS